MADGYLEIYVDSQTGQEYTADTLPPHLRERALGAREVSSFGSDVYNSLKEAGYGLASRLSGIGEYVGDGITSLAPLGYAAQNAFQPMSSLSSSDPEDSRDFYADLAALGERISSGSREFADYTRQKEDEARNQIVQDPNSPIYNFGIEAIPTAAKTFGAAIPAIVTKNPALLGSSLTGMFVGEGFGSDYQEGQAAGLDNYDSSMLALERMIPNYIQAKAIDPIGATGAMSNMITQPAKIAASTALDLGNRYVTDQMMVKGEDPTLEGATEFVTNNMIAGAPDMVGALVGGRIAGEITTRSQAKKNQTLVQDLEGTVKPLNNIESPELEGVLTPIEDSLAKPKPVDVKEKIDLTQQDSAVPKVIDESRVEDSQTVIKTEEDVLRQTDSIAEMDGEMAKILSLVDEVEVPEKIPDPIDTTAEVNLNQKIDDVFEFKTKVDKTSDALKPLVERKLVDPDKAVAVSEAILENVLGESARQLQLDFVQRAEVSGLSPDGIRTLANETSNLSRVKSQLELASEPVDLLNKLESYRREIEGFEGKIGDKSPFKAGVNANKYKNAIRDEAAHVLDPYSDPDFFRALDQVENDPKAIRKLVKDRLEAKDKGLIRSYRDSDQASFIETIKSEKGAVNPDLFGFKAFKNATENIKRNIHQQTDANHIEKLMFDEIKQRVIDEVGEIIPGKFTDDKVSYDIDLFMQGKIKTLESIPGWDKIPDDIKKVYEKPLSIIRDLYVQPKKVAELDIDGGDLMRAYNLTHKKENMKSIVRTTLLEKLVPYSDLSDKSKVNAILWQRSQKAKQAFQQKKRITFSDSDYAKLGANEDDIAAIKAYDETMRESWKVTGAQIRDYVARRILNPEEKAAKLKQVNEFLKAKEITYYIPETRSGKYVVYAQHGQSDAIPPFYNRYKTRAEAQRVAEQLTKNGYNPNPIKEWRPPTDSAIAAMPDEILLDLNSIIDDPNISPGFSIPGFKSHLLARKEVFGVPSDVFDQTVKYLNGAAATAMEWKYDDKIKGLLSQTKYKQSEGAKYLREWYDYTKKNTGEFSAVRNLISQHTLGFGQVSSAAINFFSPITSIAPELSKITGVAKTYPEMAKSQLLFSQYKASPESFKKKNPQLFAALQLADKVGELGGNVKDFYGLEQTGIGAVAQSGFRKISEAGMFLQKVTEANNRGIAFIAAYNNAPKGQNKFSYAQDFNNKVNGDYSRLNRPRRARGGFGASTYSMKLFAHNYLSNLFETVRGVGAGAKQVLVNKNSAGLKKIGKNLGALTLYGAPLALTGGILSLPMMADLVNIGGALGIDVMGDLEKAIEDPSLASDVVHGIPLRMFGISVRGALGTSVGLDAERTPEDTIASSLLGMPYELGVKRPRRIYKALREGNVSKAIEGALPRGLARPYESYVAANDIRGFIDTSGRAIADPEQRPTTFDLIANSLGFQPEGKIRPRQMTNSMYITTNRDKALTEGLSGIVRNSWAEVLNAKQSGDRERFKAAKKSLLQEALTAIERGVEPDRVEEKFFGKQAEKEIKGMLSPSDRLVSSARKPIREELKKIIKENKGRLTRNN